MQFGRFMRHIITACCFVTVCFIGPYNQDAGLGSARADIGPKKVIAPILELSEVVSFEGQRGVWFPMPTARRLLRELHIGRGAVKMGNTLELRLETEVNKGRLLEQQLTTAISEIEVWKTTAEDRQRQLEQVASTPWYREPYTWAIVGFFLGVGSTALIAWSLDR